MITKQVLITILLLAILTTNTFFTITELRRHIEEENISVLYDSLDNHIQSLSRSFENDKNCMKIIGRIISQHNTDNYEELASILSANAAETSLHRLYLLFPDNRLLSQDGTFVPNTTSLDFAVEQKKTSYISSKQEQFADLQKPLIYQSVPVVRDGAIIAILYSTTELDLLTNTIKLSCWNEQEDVYLIEGEGENDTVLVDTWNSSPTTLHKLGEHKPDGASEFSISTSTRHELEQSEVGLKMFLSQKVKDYFYVCYKPVGINNWKLAISLPEKVVFKHMNAINRTLTIFTIIKFLSIIFYLIWILKNNWKESIEKEAQLTHVNYMFDIQRTLFDAHQNPEHVQDALEKIAKKLLAETAFFITFEKEAVKETYLWSTSDIEFPANIFSAPKASSELRETGHYIVHDIELLADTTPQLYEHLKQLNIQNFMAALVGEFESNVIGVLGVCNMAHKWEDSRYLDYVVANFFLAYRNMHNQAKIHEMASYDMLTGLLNRNSHERALKQYASSSTKPDGCIYVDVNGLHEVNNQFGHAAGDEMLRFIASAMQQIFGNEHTYRIGGDEFLVFIFRTPREQIEQQLAQLFNLVEQQNYHISIGLEYPEQEEDISLMLARAEKDMYEEKKKYYKAQGRKMRR